jgi:hypothetical protein
VFPRPRVAREEFLHCYQGILEVGQAGDAFQVPVEGARRTLRFDEQLRVRDHAGGFRVLEYSESEADAHHSACGPMAAPETSRASVEVLRLCADVPPTEACIVLTHPNEGRRWQAARVFDAVRHEWCE